MDRGNNVVVINKSDCETKIKDILSDSTKFKQLEIDENKQLNFSLNNEKKLKDIINLYINKSVSRKKNMIRFTQWDQDQNTLR